MWNRMSAIAVTAAAIGIVGCASSGERAEREVEMPFASVPEPVQATLTREANGATVSTVEREMENGAAVYEADIMQGGKTWEVKVAADGKLLSKEMDDDEGADDDDKVSAK